MTRSERRLSVLRLLGRVDWVSGSDVYEALDCCAGADPRRHNQVAVALHRSRVAGFVQVDASRWPRLYRITAAGRAELAVLNDSEAYRQRMVERMRKLTARRWPRSVAA